MSPDPRIDPIDGLTQRTFERTDAHMALAQALNTSLANFANLARFAFPDIPFAGTDRERLFAESMVLLGQGLVNQGLRGGLLVDVAALAVVPNEPEDINWRERDR